MKLHFFLILEHCDRHKKVHEGVKDYHCDSCDKSFFQKGQLQRHLHTSHGGPGDHICETCGKSFFAKADMRKHIDSVHLKKSDVWKRKSK